MPSRKPTLPIASNDPPTDEAEHIPADAARRPGDSDHHEGDLRTKPARTKKTVNGLIETLFDTLDDLRENKVSPDHATAVCRLSAHIMMAMNTRRRIEELAQVAGDKDDQNKLLKLVG